MLKPTKYIWIAEDHDAGELICATYHFEDLIDYLCDNSYLKEDHEIYFKDRNNNWVWKTLFDLYGDNWCEVIKRFSAKKLDVLLDWDISMRQIELFERMKD